MADEQSRVQTAVIKDITGRVTGSGFLLTRNLVLTCAHVVADALGASSSGDRPRGEVRVGLPALLTDLRAEVMVGGWLPLGDDRQGDLAVLSFLGPAPHSILPAYFERVRPGAAVHLHGVAVHPREDEGDEGDEERAGPGQWRGVVRDAPGGGSARWTRIDFTHEDPWPGMSGAAVFDSDTGAVVGVLQAAGRDDARTVGWMLPVRDALEHVPVGRPRHDRRSLTPSETGALVEALSGVMGVLDPATFDLLLRVLADQMPDLVASLPRAPVPRVQLISLVKACASDANGLRALSESLELLYPGSVELEAFRDLVDQLTARPLLLPAERQSLHELLARAVAPAEARPGRGGADALVERAVALEDAPVAEGEPPELLAFVSGVARQAAPRVSRQLHLWNREVAERLGTAVGPAAEEPKTSGGSPVLKFTLTEAAWVAGHYDVLASLLPAGGDLLPLSGSDRPMPLVEVQELVRHTLRETRMRWVGPDSEALRVEFELPRQLLELGVESWSADDADDAEEGGRIGMLHPVTVRLAGRPPSAGPDWRERWRALATRSGRATPRWLEGGEVRVLCVAPHGDLPRSAPRPLDAALAAGVPIAIWSRNGTAESEARIQELAEHTDLATLPEAVLELRRSFVAWADDIVLFYEDPRSALPEPPLLDPFGTS